MLYSTKSAAFAAFMAAGVSSVAACGPTCSHSHDDAEHKVEEHQEKFETTDAELDAMDVDGEVDAMDGEDMGPNHGMPHGEDMDPNHEMPQPRQLSEEELEEEALKHNSVTLEKLNEVFRKLETAIGLPPMNPVQMLFEMENAPEDVKQEGPLTAEDLLEQAEMVLNNPDFAQETAGMGEDMEMPSMDDMDLSGLGDMDLSGLDDMEGTEVDAAAEESKEDL